MVSIIFVQCVDGGGNKWSRLKQNISNEALTNVPSFLNYSSPITFAYFFSIISYYRQNHNNSNTQSYGSSSPVVSL